jgi:hypothetical protein
VTAWQNLSKLPVEPLVAKMQLIWVNHSSGDSGQKAGSFSVDALPRTARGKGDGRRCWRRLLAL